MMVSCCDAWLPVYSKHCVAYVCARIYARVYCTWQYTQNVVVKTVHVRYLIS